MIAARIVSAVAGAWALAIGVLLMGDAGPLLAGSLVWCWVMVGSGLLCLALTFYWQQIVGAFAASTMGAAMLMRAFGYVVATQLPGTTRTLGMLLWLGLATALLGLWELVVMPGHRGGQCGR